MDGSTIPLQRHKRLSKDEKQDDVLPTPEDTVLYMTSLRSAPLATVVISLVWFAQVVAPMALTSSVAPAAAQKLDIPAQKLGAFMAMGTGLYDDRSIKLKEANVPNPKEANALGHTPYHAEDKQYFVLTCSLVHTVIVCVGIAFGRDARTMGRNWTGPCLRAFVAAFAFLCVVLRLAWDYQIGPVPAVVAQHGELQFVIFGALSMSGWLGASMMVPLSTLGDAAIGSTALHTCIAAVGLAMAFADVSVTSSLECFAVSIGLGLIASSIASVGISSRSTKHSLGNF